MVSLIFNPLKLCRWPWLMGCEVSFGFLGNNPKAHRIVKKKKGKTSSDLHPPVQKTTVVYFIGCGRVFLIVDLGREE